MNCSLLEAGERGMIKALLLFDENFTVWKARCSLRTQCTCSVVSAVAEDRSGLCELRKGSGCTVVAAPRVS